MLLLTIAKIPIVLIKHTQTITKATKTRNITTIFTKFKTRKQHNLETQLHDISSLQVKKRPIRKKRSPIDEETPKQPGLYDVTAFATAEEYDLERLIIGLKEQDLYEPYEVDSNSDVVHVVAKYPVSEEPRGVFFFREGSVVLWNVGDDECSSILGFLRKYERERYGTDLVQEEMEVMGYKHQEDGKPTELTKSGDLLLNTTENPVLDKYTFSNGLALSVKLCIWEACLERYIDGMESITEDLKLGRKIKMSREEVLKKHGELFALRHLINLSSDLLDTPDFYWEHEKLEQLYLKTCAYFSISKRTRVMNEKLNHCIELIELLSTHLSDRHHIRLEWMIILLILVEVVFEIVHYLDRYLS